MQMYVGSTIMEVHSAVDDTSLLLSSQKDNTPCELSPTITVMEYKLAVGPLSEPKTADGYSTRPPKPNRIAISARIRIIRNLAIHNQENSPCKLEQDLSLLGPSEERALAQISLT